MYVNGLLTSSSLLLYIFHIAASARELYLTRGTNSVWSAYESLITELRSLVEPYTVQAQIAKEYLFNFYFDVTLTTDCSCSDTDAVLTQALLLWRLVVCGWSKADSFTKSRDLKLYKSNFNRNKIIWRITFGLAVIAACPSLVFVVTHSLVWLFIFVNFLHPII